MRLIGIATEVQLSTVADTEVLGPNLKRLALTVSVKSGTAFIKFGQSTLALSGLRISGINKPYTFTRKNHGEAVTMDMHAFSTFNNIPFSVLEVLEGEDIP